MRYDGMNIWRGDLSEFGVHMGYHLCIHETFIT
jgi:hypothetical protein